MRSDGRPSDKWLFLGLGHFPEEADDERTQQKPTESQTINFVSLSIQYYFVCGLNVALRKVLAKSLVIFLNQFKLFPIAVPIV